MSANKPALSGKKSFLSKDTRYQFWRILNLACFGLLLLIMGWTALFVYQNVYSTQDDAQAIYLLNKNLSLDIINVPDFEKVKKLIDSKKNETVWPANLRNVFFYAVPAATSTYAATSTKK